MGTPSVLSDPDRRRTLRPGLDEPVDAAQAEAVAMRMIDDLHDRVARERETVRALREHLGF